MIEWINFVGRKRPIVFSNGTYLLFAHVMGLDEKAMTAKATFSPYEMYAMIFAGFKQGHIDKGIDFEYSSLGGFIDVSNANQEDFSVAAEVFSSDIKRREAALEVATELLEDQVEVEEGVEPKKEPVDSQTTT